MSSVSHFASPRKTLAVLLSLTNRRSLDGWIGYAAISCVVVSLVSIAAASIFLGVALALWLLRGLVYRDFRFSAPAFGPWIAAYVSSVMISIVFSLDPAISSLYLLKLLKLSLPFLLFSFMTRSQVLASIPILIGVMTLSALLGIGQYLWWHEVTLLNRITGFMSHWMTFAGQLMLVLVTLSCFLLFKLFPAKKSASLGHKFLTMAPYTISVSICAVALLWSKTRSAWLGGLAGAALLILRWNWRWVLPAIAGVTLFFFILPQSFKQRVYDGFSLQDQTMQGRIELIQTGVQMVRTHPLTGVGPRMVPRSAAAFRTRDDFPDFMYGHLHNSPLQIAAELGLLTLAIWLAFWLYTLQSLWRLARRHAGDPEACWLALNGIAATVAFLCAGVLEFNFGDAEVIILLLFLITAPYVVIRESKTA